MSNRLGLFYAYRFGNRVHSTSCLYSCVVFFFWRDFLQSYKIRLVFKQTHIWPIYETPTDTTASDYSGFGGDGNKGVLCNYQIYMTGDLSTDTV